MYGGHRNGPGRRRGAINRAPTFFAHGGGGPNLIGMNLYRVAQCLVATFARLFLRVRVTGVAHIPNERAVIVASNHASYFDIPLLGLALPRPANYLAKHELLTVPLLGPLLRALGAIPVRRGRGDRGAIAEAVRRLALGQVVVIYPEGTRSKDGMLGSARPGIGMVVAQTGAAVVPVFIQGTRALRPFRRVTLAFGPPMTFEAQIGKQMDEPIGNPAGVRRGECYATIAELVMNEITRLQREEGRVVWK